MDIITGALSGASTIAGQLTGTGTVSGSLSVGHANVEYYTGEYEFTPGEEAQTIPIAEKTAVTDITINPIPQNYGLITWNGSTLMVS